MPGRTTSIALCAQAFALLEENIPVSCIIEITNFFKSSIYYIKKITYECGYNPATSQELKNKYFTDSSRSGCPKVITAEVEDQILASVKINREGREQTSWELGYDTRVSVILAWRVLRSHGLRKRKPTWKSGLTPAMQSAHLKFARDHENWTLEDWKNVIWSDKTSVILGHKREGTQVWRTREKRFEKTVIHTQWRKASEFMF